MKTYKKTSVQSSNVLFSEGLRPKASVFFQGIVFLTDPISEQEQMAGFMFVKHLIGRHEDGGARLEATVTCGFSVTEVPPEP